MPSQSDPDVISRVELTLPKNVLQTCVALPCGLGAEFLATNFDKKTRSRLEVFKQEDESVKISLTVSHLSHDAISHPQHILIEGVKNTVPELADVDKFDPFSCGQISQVAQPSVSPTGAIAVRTACSSNQSEVIMPITPSPPKLYSSASLTPAEMRTRSNPKIRGMLDFSTPGSFSDVAKQHNLLDAIIAPQLVQEGCGILPSLNNSMDKMTEETLNTPEYLPNSASLECISEDGSVVTKTDRLEELHSKAMNVSDEVTLPDKVLEFEDEEPFPLDMCRPQIETTNSSEKEGDRKMKEVFPTTRSSVIGSSSSHKGFAVMQGRECAIQKQQASTSSTEAQSGGGDDPNQGKTSPSRFHHPRKEGRSTRSSSKSIKTRLISFESQKVCDKAVSNCSNVSAEQSFSGENCSDDDNLMEAKTDGESECNNGLSRRRRIKPVRYRDIGSVGEEVSLSDSSKEEGKDLGVVTAECLELKEKKQRRVKPANRSEMKRPHYKREKNIACKFCQSKLKDVQSLHNHIQSKHKNVEGYKDCISELRPLMKVVCPLCDKVFTSNNRLSFHKKMVHAENCEVKCPKCEVVLKSERHLKNHIGRIHNSRDNSFLCHLCPASFRLQIYLTSHLKHVHTENAEDAFPCDQCDKKCSTLKYLKNHKMRVHSAKNYTCKYCSKAFAIISNMKRHVLLKHERGDEKPFVCEECGKTFTLAANLKHHVNTIHLNKYNLYCSICNLGLCRKKDLEMHKTTVHGSGMASRLVVGSTSQKKMNSVPINVVPYLCGGQAFVTVEANGEEGASVPNPTEGIQYIVATPEMMQAFGVQLGPEEVEDGGHVPSTSLGDKQTS